ncbi:MAG: hypothetical protein O2816_19340 [Planctomycetota bacterium]|nr:hypothetical protein [Planctomycetota bacterium]
MRSILAPTLALIITLTAGSALVTSAARAEGHEAARGEFDSSQVDASAEIIEQLSHDLTTLAINTPIWLANHLPATMAQSSLGAGISLEGDGKGFAFGIVPLRLGLFNKFNQVGKGTELLDFENVMPANLPWLQLGVTAGFALGHGFEVGLDVQGIPRQIFDVGTGASAKVQLISAAASLRWRINDPRGLLPAFILGVGGSYYLGDMQLGAGYSDDYTITETVDTPAGPQDVVVKGTYSFSGSPLMRWQLFQVAPEVRLAWKFGPIRPYVGASLGFTYGEVIGGARLSAKVTVDEINGEAVDLDPLLHEERNDIYSTTPAKFTVRPHIGLDIMIAIVALSIQLDLAVMNNDPASTDLESAAGNYDPNAEGGLLFNEASKKSQTDTALVTTVALRFNF